MGHHVMFLFFVLLWVLRPPTLSPSHKVARHGVFLSMCILYNVDITIETFKSLSSSISEIHIPLALSLLCNKCHNLFPLSKWNLILVDNVLSF